MDLLADPTCALDAVPVNVYCGHLHRSSAVFAAEPVGPPEHGDCHRTRPATSDRRRSNQLCRACPSHLVSPRDGPGRQRHGGPHPLSALTGERVGIRPRGRERTADCLRPARTSCSAVRMSSIAGSHRTAMASGAWQVAQPRDSPRTTRRAISSTFASVRPPTRCSCMARMSSRRTSAEVGICSAVA